MKTRPVSVSVIGWLLIVMGGLSFFSILLTINNPMVHEAMSGNPLPIPILYTVSFLNILVMIASGIGILKGYNWARWLYVIWNTFEFFVGFTTFPVKRMMLPGLVVFLIIVFFLFSPPVNAFFASAKKPDKA